MYMNKLKELLFLKSIPGVGKVKIRKKYIDFLNSNIELKKLFEIIIENEKDVNESILNKLYKDASDLYEKLIKDKDIKIITMFDEEYPNKLNDLGNKAPIILYIKGNYNCINQDNIAIVGTREPSIWSQMTEERLIKKIFEVKDYIITSGLALGCDGIAHKITIESTKKTIAVLPSGFNKIMPKQHEELADKIIETGGCLISEYEPNQEAIKSNYVERDVIIAAISDATIVIECGEKSGTMHTVENAIKINRLVGAYWNSDREKGNYTGNEMILKNKNTYKLENTENLVSFIDAIKQNEINNNDDSSENEQISLL